MLYLTICQMGSVYHSLSQNEVLNINKYFDLIYDTSDIL